MLTSTFDDKILRVYRDGKQLIEQPFRPTSSGDKPEWTDEQEALDWFIDGNFSIVATQEELDEFVAALNSANP